MAKRWEIVACDAGECTVIGQVRDEAKAKARAKKEYARRTKRHMKDNPEASVHVEVRGVERGVYDTETLLELESGERPKRGRARSRKPAPGPVDTGT